MPKTFYVLGFDPSTRCYAKNFLCAWLRSKHKKYWLVLSATDNQRITPKVMLGGAVNATDKEVSKDSR